MIKKQKKQMVEICPHCKCEVFDLPGYLPCSNCGEYYLYPDEREPTGNEKEQIILSKIKALRFLFISIIIFFAYPLMLTIIGATVIATNSDIAVGWIFLGIGLLLFHDKLRVYKKRN